MTDEGVEILCTLARHLHEPSEAERLAEFFTKKEGGEDGGKEIDGKKMR